jgi:hypothetical protein
MTAKSHGLSNTWLYKLWGNVKYRCENKDGLHYHNYGGRGITLHPPWSKDFLAFAKAVGERPSPLHTLERIKNDRGYVPGNIGWATRKEQAHNMRKNVRVTIDGRTQILSAWGAELGINMATVYYRLSKGMTHKEALLTPRRSGRLLSALHG